MAMYFDGKEINENLIVKEFNELGLSSCVRGKDLLMSLNEVFGLNPSYYNESLIGGYGVKTISFGYYGDIDVEIQNGCREYHIFNRPFAPYCPNTKKADRCLLTTIQKKRVAEVLESVAENRKKQIENNKKIIADFDNFCKNCLSIAEEAVGKDCICRLTKGHSLSNKNVSNAIVFLSKDDNSQIGYIRLYYTKFNDIVLDSCDGFSHCSTELDDALNCKDVLSYLCKTTIR